MLISTPPVARVYIDPHSFKFKVHLTQFLHGIFVSQYVQVCYGAFVKCTCFYNFSYLKYLYKRSQIWDLQG